MKKETQALIRCYDCGACRLVIIRDNNPDLSDLSVQYIYENTAIPETVIFSDLDPRLCPECDICRD